MYNIGYFDTRFDSIWFGSAINPMTNREYEHSVCFNPKLMKMKPQAFMKVLEKCEAEIMEDHFDHEFVVGNNVDIFDHRVCEIENAVSLLEYLFYCSTKSHIVIITGSAAIANPEVMALLREHGQRCTVIFRLQAAGPIVSHYRYNNCCSPEDLKNSMDKLKGVVKVEAIIGPFLPMPDKVEIAKMIDFFKIDGHVKHLYFTCYSRPDFCKMSANLDKKKIGHSYQSHHAIHACAEDPVIWESYVRHCQAVFTAIRDRFGFYDEMVSDETPELDNVADPFKYISTL